VVTPQRFAESSSEYDNYDEPSIIKEYFSAKKATTGHAAYRSTSPGMQPSARPVPQELEYADQGGPTSWNHFGAGQQQSRARRQISGSPRMSRPGISPPPQPKGRAKRNSIFEEFPKSPGEMDADALPPWAFRSGGGGGGGSSSSREVFGNVSDKAWHEAYVGDKSARDEAKALTPKGSTMGLRRSVPHPHFQPGTRVSFHLQGRWPSKFFGRVSTVLCISSLDVETDYDAGGRPVSLAIEVEGGKQFVGRVHSTSLDGTHVLDLVDDGHRSRVEVVASGPDDPMERPSLSIKIPDSEALSTAPPDTGRTHRSSPEGTATPTAIMSPRSLMSPRSQTTSRGQTPRSRGLRRPPSLSGISMKSESRSSLASNAPITAETPVTFFLEGRPTQIYGRVRLIAADGTYMVELAGGARMAGVQAVTRCREDDLVQAHGRRRKFGYERDSYEDLHSPNSPHRDVFGCFSARDGSSSPIRGGTPRSMAPSMSMASLASSANQSGLARGAACKFTEEGNPRVFYGRIKSISKDGTYMLDLVGGGKKVGVDLVTLCTEDDLQKDEMSKMSMSLAKDSYKEYCHPCLPTFRAGGSPARVREQLVVGCPVKVPLEGSLTDLYGWIKSEDRDGSYTVELVGGGRKVAVTVLEPCSDAAIWKAEHSQVPIVTRRDDYRDRDCPNREDIEHAESSTLGSISSRRSVSPSSRSPRLNGVVITRLRSPRGLWP